MSNVPVIELKCYIFVIAACAFSSMASAQQQSVGTTIHTPVYSMTLSSDLMGYEVPRVFVVVHVKVKNLTWWFRWVDFDTFRMTARTDEVNSRIVVKDARPLTYEQVVKHQRQFANGSFLIQHMRLTLTAKSSLDSAEGKARAKRIEDMLDYQVKLFLEKMPTSLSSNWRSERLPRSVIGSSGMYLNPKEEMSGFLYFGLPIRDARLQYGAIIVTVRKGDVADPLTFGIRAGVR